MYKIKKFIKIPYHFILNSGKKIRNFLFPTARILLYHRVADVHNDPHFLSVSVEKFRQQIKFLKENFKIIPLVKLVQDIRAGKIQKNTIVITFDDGYADNLYNALPVLEEFTTPATVFLTAGYFDLPTRVSPNRPFHWDQNTPEQDQGRPITPDEAKHLSNSYLIEIGGHTIGHPKLATLPENEQFKEIGGSKKMLEEILNIPLLSFAYPFGDINSFTPETISMVKKAGYHYACANIHERVTAKSNIYALPRFIVRNWNAKELKKEMEKWL